MSDEAKTIFSVFMAFLFLILLLIGVTPQSEELTSQPQTVIIRSAKTNAAILHLQFTNNSVLMVNSKTGQHVTLTNQVVVINEP